MSDSLTQQGIHAFQQGDYDTARELLRKALQENEIDEQAWYHMALLEADLRQKRKHLQKVLQINRQNQTAQIELARITGELRQVPVKTPAQEADTLQADQDNTTPKPVTLTPEVKPAKTLHTTATVSSDGYLNIRLKVDMAAGTYRTVIVLEET